MRIVHAFMFTGVIALFLTVPVVIAQEPPAVSPTTRLVPVSGTLTDAAGTPLAGAQTVTFALFDEADAGTLLWSETQTVTADERGRYLAYLGAAVSLPLGIFRSEQARWLQVSMGGRDLPRVMLVAVPYALKAADAETVGGKPASAFVLTGEQTAGKGTIGAGSIAPLATSGTPGYLGMFTSATDLGNSNIYQNASMIGVNTSAPDALFHVRGDLAPAAFIDVYNNALGALPLVFRAARGTPGAPLPVQTDDILGGLAVRAYAPSGFTGGKGQIMFRAAENWTDTANGTVLQFMTTPTGSTTFAERMRITPEGRVAIGTTTASVARLRVVTAPGGPSDAIAGETSVPGGVSMLGFAQNGTGVAGLVNSGTGVIASSFSGTALTATSSTGDIIARFNGPGNVSIGASIPADKLHVAGDIRIGTGTTGCVKDADGSVIAGACSSDRRLKHAVTPFARSLETVARLQPVSFSWRAGEFPERHFGATRSFGLIAQDVEAVLPALVTTDEKGYKAVRYHQLPFYLLQAIKDLKAENDLLKEQLKTQEARLQWLEQAARR